MVDIVSEALRANKLPYVKCTNRSKDFGTGGDLERFRNDSAVRVLVMPLGLGAEGLDLIIASHVFLLEPLLNVHQELQAVNRVHRVGQLRPTFVHKYVLQGTIEERIVHVQQRQHAPPGESQQQAEDTVQDSGATVLGASRKGKQQRDDDQLSEAELRYILNLPSARALGTAEVVTDLMSDGEDIPED
jgi:superfamily II DNA or RNA helicase